MDGGRRRLVFSTAEPRYYRHTEWSIGMTDKRPFPIVIGVDGSIPARRALNWAVSEAIARRRPLHIVHCLTGPLMRYPFVSSGTEPPDGGFEGAAERVLTDALKRVESAAPGISATTELVLEAPASALLRQAHDAELLVVGSGGSRSHAGFPTESVGLAVAAQAPCPVVVVHPNTGGDLKPLAGRIVVGVSRLHPSAPAIRFAFESAARREVGLTAVWVWPPPVWGYPRLVTGVDIVEAVERKHLVESFEYERNQFPEVEFEVKLVRHHHHAGRALILESEDADLLVVGGGRGGLAGMLGGSVTRSVVEHGKCPVAVVGREATANRGTPPVPSQASRASREHPGEPRRSTG
jgi:nucleotide-binding universal stress UspA family protein